MAKRFTDTEKWRDEWFGSLTNDYRMIWLYLVDSCSHAGIWKKDFRGLNFNCNTKITEDEFKKIFGARIIDRPSFYFLPKFIRFQYPKGLNSNKPAIVSVRKELEFNNLSLIINQSFGNDFLIVKDMDKVKDKVMDTDKVKDKDIEEILKGLDEIYLDSERMKWPHIDFDFELNTFRNKVRGSPSVYAGRDSAGIRLAFQSQLRNAKNKPNGKPFNKKQQQTDELIRAHAARWGVDAPQNKAMG